jgi:hypothetical protein
MPALAAAVGTKPPSAMKADADPYVVLALFALYCSNIPRLLSA